MGRAQETQASIPYRDDAASTSSAVPLRDHVFADDEAPPAYTDDPDLVQSHQSLEDAESATSSQAPGGGSIHLEPKTHEDSRGSTATYISKLLSTDPKTCQWFVECQALRAPRPMVRVIGSHMETRQRDKKEEKQRVTDFDLKVPLGGLLEPAWARSRTVHNAQKTYRGGIFKQVDPRMTSLTEAAETPPSLKEWCHRFCASSASTKSFTISRNVTEIEHHILTQQMTGILRGTNYRGHISITFPVNSRATVIVSDNWINRYRHNKFVWWVCVILQLWIFTWPLLFFMTKRWEVYSVKWPCRIHQRFDGSWPNSHKTAPNMICEGQPTKDPRIQIAHMSEADWAQQWKLAVQFAAESKKVGILTDADRRLAIEVQDRQRLVSIQDNGLLVAATGLLSGVQGLMSNPQNLQGWGGDR
ncbi:MAG: hypothetical protein Q9170_002642 [Blastenia crenularia]